MPDIPNNDQDEESPANAVASQLLLKQAVTNGLNAAKKNRLPGIALWLFGSAIIAGYYLVPSIHDYLERVGELKIRWGLGFSAVSTGVCGGLIPSLIRKAVNRRQNKQEKSQWNQDKI